MPLPFPLWVPTTSLQYKEDKVIPILLLFKELSLKQSKSTHPTHTHTHLILENKTEKPPRVGKRRDKVAISQLQQNAREVCKKISSSRKKFLLIG